MDNQPILPPTPGMFPASGRTSSAASPLLLILVIILGLGALIFAILTMTFSAEASKAQSTLTASEKAAAQSAAAAQKKIDAKDYEAASESPFQTYTASALYGSFVLRYPKNWSTTIDQEQTGNLITIDMNPNYIATANGQLSPVATQVQLIQEPAAQYMQNFSGDEQNGNLTQSNITVSGQPAYNVTGTFDDGITVREVVIPVRDQVLVFSSQNSQYAAEFNEILAQCTVLP